MTVRWRAAVLGKPVAHSLSPLIHNAGYAALGLADWDYGRFEVDEASLPGFVADLDDSWRGLSLTMPLKRACLEVADEVSDLAAEAGVGNTLIRLPDGRWRADNTDIGGIVDVLRPYCLSPVGVRIAILGAGATALSAVLAARELGVSSVRIYARDPDAAARLAARATDLGLEADTRPLSDRTDDTHPLPDRTDDTHPLSDRTDDTHATESILVSTLPPGALTFHRTPALAPSACVTSGPKAGVRRLRRYSVIFDVVYAGWPTPLARAAAASGVPVISGFDLLLAQAARQFKLFTGCDAPTDAMRAALDEHRRIVVFVGFMGSGKTTVGRLVAQRLGKPFIDTDQLIEDRHGPIPDIFALQGEAAFRDIEAQVIAECLAGDGAVLALGGGAVETPSVREALAGHEVVWLRTDFDAALARVHGDRNRPVLTDPRLRDRFDARQPFYAQVATRTIDGSGPPEPVVRRFFRANGDPQSSVAG